MSNEIPELIVCAAMYDVTNRIIYPCVRHSDEIFWTLIDTSGIGDGHERRGAEYKEGFLTNKKRFVGRAEAFDIAEKQGQIRRVLPCDHARRLYSENLY